MNGSVSLVLLHYPVVDKAGNEITSAVTNLDLHDLARISCTYGAGEVWIVTPIPEQQQLVRDIVTHWTDGHGGRHNPDRRLALSCIRLAHSLGEVVESVAKQTDGEVFTVATSAKKIGTTISFAGLRQLLERQAGRYLLLLGTSWGISGRLLATVDYLLEPIEPDRGYNHLPVRAAAAIMFDRLLARRPESR
ncbi:MAG: RNA methyltransferase [Deltaproteobacteria bacterium]|nr:RNA methyltransferase [Candidatus Anaeroferrophillus wilburensis]MBN2889077.1 RNA methyltransferase [Deltaproteobacteria bacterium]